MRHPRTQHVVRVLAAAMLASFALRADAQEKPAEPKPQESKQAETKPAPSKPAEAKPAPEKPEITLPQLGGGDGGKEEMIKLFHEVEQKLQEVDRLLYDAGAGTAVGGELADSGIDRLLRDAQARSSSAQQGIDRILELARQQQQQQSSSSGGTGSEQQPQGDSPLDEPRRQGEQQREKKPGGKAPDSQGKPEQPQPTGEPKSPKDSKDDPTQQQGTNPPKGAKGAPSQPGDDRERWGELPEQVRDVFRVQGGDDLPPRYRDFIDSYYRRMSKRP
ncbi:MAG: hypothetical protein IT453_12135 [Planctomycetes bacterium]|nr:hypothetical protein [Planctomycetota bacterium]